MMSLLDQFGQASRARAEADMLETPLAQFEQLIETFPPVRSLAARLGSGAGRPPRVIAEMKKASPSAGLLREEYMPRQIALGYTRVGASALSVLTEPDRFGGDLSHLVQVRAAHLPVLRKDFLVTPYQVAQSRVAGADAVLLIAALLTGPSLGIMVLAARRYGVESLVEVHDEEEVSRAIDQGAGLIGVNNRDLRTLEVDLRTSERLAPKLPKGGVVVAESGIRSRRDIDRLMQSGYEAFLIGEALMRERDPGDALWKILQPIE
jgi:indole-3-glycerol phosphate synthase